MGFRGDFTDSKDCSTSEYENSGSHDRSRLAMLLSIIGFKKKSKYNKKKENNEVVQSTAIIPETVPAVEDPLMFDDSPDHHTKKKKPRKKHHPAKVVVVSSEAVREEEVQEEEYDYKRELEGIAEEEAHFAAISLMDYDMHRKGRVISTSRQASRQIRKQQDREMGVVDSVTRNSGPDPALIPPGWSAEPNPPIVLDDSLLKRRCMVYWNVPKEATGWFSGNIIGQCDRDGKNYLVKYDRAETGNLFVDGVKPTTLLFMGEEAYGVSWILLVRSEDIPRPNSRSPTSPSGGLNNTMRNSPVMFESRSLPVTPYSPMLPVTHEKSRAMSATFTARFISPIKASKVFCLENVNVNELSPLNPVIGIPRSVALPFIQNLETNF